MELCRIEMLPWRKRYYTGQKIKYYWRTNGDGKQGVNGQGLDGLDY